VPVSIVERDGRLAVTTPFHPDFPARARMLGGVWDGARRVWLFDPVDSERGAFGRPGGKPQRN
jgi:hypothetical protein